MAVPLRQPAASDSLAAVPSILWDKPRYKRSPTQTLCRPCEKSWGEKSWGDTSWGETPWRNISRKDFTFRPRPSIRAVNGGVPEGISGIHFEALESRFLLSADSIVPGLIGALESGLAGTDSTDGFADMLEQLIEAGGDPAFDNHVPGLAFDEPASDGVLAPTIRDLLSIDTDRDNDGSTDSSGDIISAINADANAQYHLADAHDIDQIAKAINAENLSGFILDEELALGLVDQNDSGRVSLTEFFEVIIIGQVSEFLEQFPGTKEVSGTFATDFADLMAGYIDDDDGAIQGFENFLTGLSVPALLADHVELSSFSFTNNDPTGTDAFDFDFDFTLTLSDQYLIDLGLAVESLEIDLPKEFYTDGGDVYAFAPDVDVMGSLAMDLGFSVTTDGAADFGFSVGDDIEIKAFVDESLVGLNVNVGFLGMFGTTGSIFELNLPFDVELIDPSSPFHLGFAQSDFEAAGDGMIEGVDGVLSATVALVDVDPMINQNVIFSLTLGNDINMSPVEVTVASASTTVAGLVADINAALVTASLDDILVASLDSGLIVVSLFDSDATDFGFVGQEHFALAGGDLTATNALTHDFTLDGELFEAAVLMSLGAAQPKLVSMSFTVTGATDTDADRRIDFLAKAQAEIDAVFGGGEITVSLDGSDHLTFDPDDGADTLEITRAVTMSAEFNITATELAAATFDELLFNTPDASNDNFNINLELLIKAGLNVSNGDLNTESLTITDDLIVDNGGVITFPLETDIASDFVDVDRFDLGGSLFLSGVDFTSFDPTSDSFQKLLDFNVIGGSEVVGLIGQLKGWLNRLPNTEILAGYDIPFAEATLGDLLNFAQLIQDELLIDDNGNGLEDLDDGARDDLDRLIGKITSLDADILSVTFATAQELSTRLGSVSLPNVSLDGVANYNVGLQELTYDITVTALGETIDEIPIDFDLDLDPITDVSVISEVTLSPTVTFEATIGFDLASSAMIDLGTLLEDLNNGDGVPISTALALTSAETLSPIFGRLSADALFEVTLAGINGGSPIEITVTKAATDTNLITADLLMDLNDAFAAAAVDISGEIEAVEIGGRIVLQSIGSVDSFFLGVDPDDAAFMELGLQSTGATTVFLTGAVIETVPDSGIASFDVFLNGSGSPTTIEIDMTDDNTVNDLVEDINAAIGSSGLNGLIAAARSGNAIVLAGVDASVDVFRIADNTDTDLLGLAAAQLDGLQDNGSYLNQIAGVFLIGENFLNTDINPDANTGSGFGRLVMTQTFAVDLGAAGSDSITVTAASTVGNTKLSDLIDQINTEIAGSGVAGLIVAVQINAGQIALRTTDDSVESIEITSDAPELGLISSIGVVDGPLRISAADLAPFYYGPATEASFFLTYEDGVSTPESFVPGDVDDSTEVVTLVGHSLETGQAVQYENTSAGSDVGGLSDEGFYFVIASDTDGALSADEIKLAASQQDALDGIAIDLTAAGAGATHELNTAVAFVVLEADDTLTNRFIYDLVSDLNFAMNDAFGSSSDNPFHATFDGQRLVIEAEDDSGITAFDLHADASNSAVTDLHLHQLVTPSNPLGAGLLTLEADRADLLIHTQDGEIHRVALDDDGTLFSLETEPASGIFTAEDIMQVLDAIDSATSSDVTGALNSAMTGINLTDNTGLGDTIIFRVESVNGSRAVNALGIQAADNNSLLADIDMPGLTLGSDVVDHVIEGDEVGSLDLVDRLFIRQVDASTPVLSAEFVLSIYVEDASAQFGFVGVDLTSLGVDPGFPIFETMKFEVALTTNKDGDPEENVTLAELFDAISLDVNKDGVFDIHDLSEVMTFATLEVVDAPATISRYDDFVFDVELQPGADFITLGTTPQLTMHMHDAGDLFNQLPGSAEFDPTIGGIVDIATDELTLLGHGFESGDQVVYRDGDGDPIEGLVDNQTYYVIKVDDDTIQLADTNVAATADTPTAVDLTGLGTTTTGPTTMHRLLADFDPLQPEMHIHTSDLEDLDNFADVDFETILAALTGLRDFLNEFADQDFLGAEIPVLGFSFNDLIDIAGRFSEAVDDITNNEPLNVQQLEQKLRESFGLPPGAGIIDLELVDDMDGPGGVDGDLKDMLKVSLDLGSSFTEVLTLDLDLGDQGLPFGDLSLLGRAGMGAAVDIDIILSVGVDLDDDDGDPFDDTDTFGEVFLFTNEDDTHIILSLDGTSTDITFNASLGPLGVAIIGGDGSFDLGFSFSDTGASVGTKVSIGDAFADFDATLPTSSMVLNLPVFFPSPSDFIGDIFFDADLIIGGVTGLDFAAPPTITLPSDLLLPDFYTSFGILSSLPLAIDGLDLLLETVQNILAGDVFNLPLPFIGDTLADGAEFIEDLRLGIIEPLQNLVENTPKTEDDLADLLKQFLFVVLGPGGSGIVDVDFLSELSSLDGLGLLLDAGGNVADAADFGNIDNIIDLVLDLDDGDGQESAIWNFDIGQTYTPDLDFGFDLGFPGLSLAMEGGLALELAWQMGIGFGINTDDGPFIDISRDEELSVSLDAGFQPGSELTGTLGFLQFTAAAGTEDLDGNGITDNNHFAVDFSVNLINGSDEFDDQLSFFELGDLRAVVDFDATADLDLGLELAFNKDLLPDVVSAILPAIAADFLFGWSLDSPDILDNGFNFDVADGLDLLAFNNVGLDLGSFIGDFLGPLVSQIQEITEPLQPIIEIITAPIPVLSDLAGKSISLVDLAATFGEFDPGFIFSLADLISFVNSIPASPDSIILPLGDFTVFGSGILSPEDLASEVFSFAKAINPESSAFVQEIADLFGDLDPLAGLFNEAGEFVQSVFDTALGGDAGSPEASSVGGLFGGDFNSEDRGGFEFPFLKDPKQIFGALLGNPIVLVTYDLAPLIVEFSYEQSFPIYGPLFGNVGAGLGVKIDLAFGYDTLGVQRFAEGGFENPLDLLAGFFISDTNMPDGSGTDVPELQFIGEITVGAELNAGVASAGIQAAIILIVDFDLNDPDSDGRVRVSELVGNFLYELNYGSPVLAPIAIFDVSGEIAFQLRAYLEILTVKFTFNITPQITLFEFSIDFDRQPILATERGDGALLLNIGPNSESRLHGNTDDIAETINVYQEGSFLFVWSDQFNVSIGAAQKYSGDSILGFGGEFDDTINIDASVMVAVELEGNTGDDVIMALGSGGGIISGDEGDDTLSGGDGEEIITGGEGNDTIDGGGGVDLIFGDTGRTSARLTSVLIRDKDGDDVITGGDGADIIFGGGGTDTIGGDGPLADLQGYAASATITDNLLDPGGSPGGDTIFGDGGRIVYQRDGVDLSEPEIRSTNTPDGKKDYLFGHGGADVIYGGAGDDIIDGGAGNDELYGEAGFDTVSGAGDSDTIFGGTEADILYGFRIGTETHGDAAGTDGQDIIEGNQGNDFIRGNEDDDTIYGGRGTDIIFGDEDNDTIFGGSDNDYIFGGADNDTVEGGTGNDIVFGDDGLVVFFDFGSLAFASSFVSPGPGHVIDGNHRLIGDVALDGGDPMIGDNDGNFRTLDLIVTAVAGTDGDDFVIGGEGDDIVIGGAGDDTIFGDFDPNQVLGGIFTAPIPADEDILDLIHNSAVKLGRSYP